MPVIQAKFEDEFIRNKDLQREDFDKLKDWVTAQPHLPPISDLMLAIFYHSCYYSNEATKACIDNYYTARALCPEFFAKRDPTSVEMSAAFKNVHMVHLPKPTKEGYVVAYVRLSTYKPDHLMLASQLKRFDMGLSLLRQQLGSSPGYVIVIDLRGVVLGHLLRLNPLYVKKYLFFLQDALPLRLKSLHFANCVSFMDKILAIVKPFMKKELIDMLRLHQPNTDTIFEYIPKECFLDDFTGGQGGDSKIVQAEQNQNLLDNRDYFIAEEKDIADESKRQGRPKTAGDLFGVEGTFKKLELD